jgi:hypothetical protein
MQQEVNFNDAFAPVARMEFVRLLLTLAAQEGCHVHHMDVKSAFLNNNFKEEVYVKPPRFMIPGMEGKVLRLRKVLYGLQQAPRVWNEMLDTTLKTGLQAKPASGCLRAGPGWQCPTSGRLRPRPDHHGPRTRMWKRLRRR